MAYRKQRVIHFRCASAKASVLVTYWLQQIGQCHLLARLEFGKARHPSQERAADLTIFNLLIGAHGTSPFAHGTSPFAHGTLSRSTYPEPAPGQSDQYKRQKPISGQITRLEALLQITDWSSALCSDIYPINLYLILIAPCANLYL